MFSQFKVIKKWKSQALLSPNHEAVIKNENDGSLQVFPKNIVENFCYDEINSTMICSLANGNLQIITNINVQPKHIQLTQVLKNKYQFTYQKCQSIHCLDLPHNNPNQFSCFVLLLDHCLCMVKVEIKQNLIKQSSVNKIEEYTHREQLNYKEKQENLQNQMDKQIHQATSAQDEQNILFQYQDLNQVDNLLENNPFTIYEIFHTENNLITLSKLVRNKRFSVYSFYFTINSNNAIEMGIEWHKKNIHFGKNQQHVDIQLEEMSKYNLKIKKISNYFFFYHQIGISTQIIRKNLLFFYTCQNIQNQQQNQKTFASEIFQIPFLSMSHILLDCLLFDSVKDADKPLEKYKVLLNYYNDQFEGYYVSLGEPKHIIHNISYPFAALEIVKSSFTAFMERNRGIQFCLENHSIIFRGMNTIYDKFQKLCLVSASMNKKKPALIMNELVLESHILKCQLLNNKNDLQCTSQQLICLTSNNQFQWIEIISKIDLQKNLFETHFNQNQILWKNMQQFLF